jgi:hypothetical protein
MTRGLYCVCPRSPSKILLSYFFFCVFFIVLCTNFERDRRSLLSLFSRDNKPEFIGDLVRGWNQIQLQVKVPAFLYLHRLAGVFIGLKEIRI